MREKILRQGPIAWKKSSFVTENFKMPFIKKVS